MPAKLKPLPRTPKDGNVKPVAVSPKKSVASPKKSVSPKKVAVPPSSPKKEAFSPASPRKVAVSPKKSDVPPERMEKEKETFKLIADIQKKISNGEINVINKSPKLSIQKSPVFTQEDISKIRLTKASPVISKAEDVKVSTKAKVKPVNAELVVEKPKESKADIIIEELWFDPKNKVEKIDLDKLLKSADSRVRAGIYTLEQLKTLVNNNPELFNDIPVSRRKTDLVNAIISRLQDIGYMKK